MATVLVAARAAHKLTQDMVADAAEGVRAATVTIMMRKRRNPKRPPTAFKEKPFPRFILRRNGSLVFAVRT
jgi:hypothetical protein